MPIDDLDARRPHPADVRLGRGDLLEARGQVVDRRGDHGHARRGDLVGDQPALARADEDDACSDGNSRLSAEHLEDVARALDVDEQILPALQHRHQRGGVEAGQQHVLAAARIGP